MREREIFIAALQRDDPRERRAYLEGACGTDAGLWDRVQALLGAFDRAGSFLLEPAVDPGATGAFIPSSEDRTERIESSPLEGPGTVIGPYTLREQIGEGGMGVVYVAEQTRPVRRKVALKIIKPGMDTKQVVARFEAERQALAMMDHPNIARVHDGGATESGRPYFVMELVRGIPITDYCDRERLSIPERLELFVLVCRAVQHAHQKGIIHRDLKPSNILVTIIDGAAVPKVIDFGVAKATGASLTERTLYTAFQQFVGTPLYMSPEQADLSGMDVDTRSDIFSLGVLLYELLTGTTPFDQDTFRTAAFDEVRRIIREQEPPKPSTRLSSLGATRATVSAHRKADARQLDRAVRGELDWIVMKALEKDRRRRYETANDFASDVMRYLTDQPVEACPPSAWYRFGKLAHRNRVVLATSALVATALILGAAVSTWQAIRATRAEQVARQQRDAANTAREAEGRARLRTEDAERTARAAERTARAEADKAKAINDFLTNDLLMQAEPTNNAVEDKLTILEAVDRAADKLGEQFRDQPEAEGALRTTLAKTYHGLASFAKAERQVQAALEIERRHHGLESAGAFDALEGLGHMRYHLGRYTEAIESLRQAAEGKQRTLGPGHPQTLGCRDNLALAYLAAGRTAEAVALEEETLKLMETRLGPDHYDTLTTRNHLAMAYLSAGRTAEAIALHEATLKLLEAKLGPDHPATLAGRNNLATAYDAAGRTAEAIALHEENLKLVMARLGPDHHDTLASRNNLAEAYRTAGRIAEAIRLHQENLKLMEARMGPDHPDTLTSRDNLALAYESLGRWVEAERLHRNVLAHRKTTAPDSPALAGVLASLAYNLMMQAKWSEAELLLCECLAIREKKLPDDFFRFNTMSTLGGSLLGQKKYAEAETLLLAGYEGMKQREENTPLTVREPRLTEAIERLVQLYEARGKLEKAAVWRAKLSLADLPADVFARP